MEYSHVRQQTPRFPCSAPHPPVNPQRAVPRPAQSSPTCRRIPQRDIERRIDALQAWEARKLLKIEQLRVVLETQEIQKSPFRPVVSAKSVEIVKALDARRAESSDEGREETAGTYRCGSARRIAKQRSESALKAASPRGKLTARQRYSPRKGSNAPTESPHFSSAETDSQADSTKTTAKAESMADWSTADRKRTTVTYRALSPVAREVRFAAGFDLAGFYQRATAVGSGRPPLP